MRVGREEGRIREQVKVAIQVKWNTRNNIETNLRYSETFLWMASNGQQLAKRSTRKFHSPFMTISCMEGQRSDHVQWYCQLGHD